MPAANFSSEDEEHDDTKEDHLLSIAELEQRRRMFNKRRRMRRIARMRRLAELFFTWWIDHVKQQEDVQQQRCTDDETELHHTRTVMLNTWRAWKSLLVCRWSWEGAQFTFMKAHVRNILRSHFKAWKHVGQEDYTVMTNDEEEEEESLTTLLDSQRAETHGTFSGLETHLEDLQDLQCLERRIVQAEPLHIDESHS